MGETKVAFLEEQYSKNNAIKSKNLILGLQARDKAAMLLVNTIIYFRWIYTKMELVPIGEKCICSVSPIWPPCRVQTSNWDFQPLTYCCPNLMRNFRKVNRCNETKYNTIVYYQIKFSNPRIPGKFSLLLFRAGVGGGGGWGGVLGSLCANAKEKARSFKRLHNNGIGRSLCLVKPSYGDFKCTACL